MKKVVLNSDYFDKEKDFKEPNSIEEIVSSDEEILWKGRPKKAAFIFSESMSMFPVALIWLLFDGTALGLMFGTGAISEIPTIAAVGIVVFFLIHMMPVWIWIFQLVTAAARWKNIEYAFTSTRIIIKGGIITDVNSVFYSDINNVNLRVGFFDRLFKVGDIYISTSSSGTVVLNDITNPYFITKKLQKVVLDIKTDMNYPNALRPDDNPGYKTKYTANPFDDDSDK